MTVRLGLIGTGIFARDSHFPAINKQDGIEVTAVFNRTKAKAEEFAKNTGIPKVFDNLDEILNDSSIDAIDALLPVQFNLQTVKRAIDANKPIAFEKPISSNIKDAREIVKLAEASDLPILVLENFVYHNSVKQLKELLPKIGRPVTFVYQSSGPYKQSKYQSTSWRQKPEHIGGYLSDGGVHQLAILTEVLGEVSSVSARTEQLKEVSGDVDTLNSQFNLKSGAYGSFLYGSFFGGTKNETRFNILGTEGSLVFEVEKGKDAVITLYEGADIDSTTSRTFAVKKDEINGVVEEFANFKEAVISKDKSLLKVTPRKAFHHLAVIAAAVESGEKKGLLVDVAQL